MDTPPPCPYKALGLAKDADAETIKKTYRKLALKCHPDKVTDESLKQQAQEEFHKIQQAYELIGDEDARARYDAETKLEQLRREKFARNGGAPNVDVRTGRYEVRTQAPAGATFTATAAHRYEEHKPTSRPYDDRYYEERSRKYDTYEAYPKHSSARPSRSEKEPPVRVSRVNTDRTRSDHKKTRDRDERRDRSHKFVSVESDSSSDEKAREKARYEAEYKRRTEDAKRRAAEEDARREAAEARRKAEEQRRAAEETKYDRQRKLSSQENDAVRYIHRSKVDADRPSPGRTTSSRDVPRDLPRDPYYESRSRRDRPEAIRRSSARPSKDRPSSSGRERDRKGIEIVDWEEERKIPAFKHSSSSPAELHVPRERATPQRAYTESSREHRRTDTSPTPVFRRSETAPTVPHANSSSRRKEATPTRPTNLRSSESMTAHDATPKVQEKYPTIPPPQASTKYYYPSSSGGVRLTAEDVGVANGHRTVLHEPNRRTRSPSPLSRPPMGPNRPSEASIPQYATAAPKISVPPPPLGRSATMNVSPVRGSEDRGRRLYGEIPKPQDYARRENTRRQTSFSPDQVSYSHKIGPEDIRWSATPTGRGRESDREYAKPTLGRHATYVY